MTLHAVGFRSPRSGQNGILICLLSAYIYAREFNYLTIWALLQGSFSAVADVHSVGCSRRLLYRKRAKLRTWYAARRTDSTRVRYLQRG
jgi:hypothetical protein